MGSRPRDKQPTEKRQKSAAKKLRSTQRPARRPKLVGIIGYKGRRQR